MAFAELQTVSVGKIDKRYSDLVSKNSLREIIKDIEALFETQLGFNVFDYSEDGKPIDILYMPPSQKKKKILRNQKQLESLKKKIDSLEGSISEKQAVLQQIKSQLSYDYKLLNHNIEELNTYILKNNSFQNLSQDDYQKVNKYISQEKENIRNRTKDLAKEKRQVNKKLAAYRMKVRKYNALADKYNYIQRNTEKISQNYTELKGITKKRTTTTYTTYTQKEASIRKKEIKADVERIEIYNFENLNLLKVILAHEIGHLIGVGHVDVDGALMHTYLQKEQVESLSLTLDDIKAIRECFISRTIK